jgi:3-oxoacyl-[acyl-carrier-protein] synthase II
MKALSTRNDDPATASRPFDKGRDGFVMGEGCGVLVLEALEHAEGARRDAARRSWSATAPLPTRPHITLPAPGGIGAVRAARIALAKAGMEPSEIGHVNAHATSTPEGDKAELQAIRTIFGDHAPNVAVTANKSMLGHTLGAAGAIEAIVTILSIREGCIPPTLNLEDPDDEGAGLDLVSGSAVRRDVDAAISNSFGFGGQNTALVFRRSTDDARTMGERREEEPMTDRPDRHARGIGSSRLGGDAAGRRAARRVRHGRGRVPARDRRPTPRCSRSSTG